MHTFEEFPSAFEEDPMLAKLAAAVRLANMTIEQLSEYEADMRTAIDRWAEINFAKEQTRAETIMDIAKAMLSDGMDPALVAKYSGLSKEELEALKGE